MFKKLQDKWKVSGWRLVLILISFAVAGSLTGYVGKKIMSITGIEAAGFYIPVYIIVVTLIWPLMVIVVSVPMGQFVFFRGYLKKMGRRMGGKKKVRNSESVVGSQELGVGSWELGVGSQELGVGSQELEEQEEMINDRLSLITAQRETENQKPTTANEQPQTRKQKRLAIFASGTGSNTQQIIDYFNSPLAKKDIAISLIVCNKPGAGVLQIAQKERIESLLIDRERFLNGDAYRPVLQEEKIDLIVLAGFLWKIPLPLINAFRNRIINIHPALLPKYGGKNMYGNKVHEAVINAGETQSGITIHLVDENYDEGDIIFQATCDVLINDTPERLAQRIHKLEYMHYPRVIEKIVQHFIPNSKLRTPNS